jgi:hypothetical protein
MLRRRAVWCDIVWCFTALWYGLAWLGVTYPYFAPSVLCTVILLHLAVPDRPLCCMLCRTVQENTTCLLNWWAAHGVNLTGFTEGPCPPVYDIVELKGTHLHTAVDLSPPPPSHAQTTARACHCMRAHARACCRCVVAPNRHAVL